MAARFAIVIWLFVFAALGACVADSARSHEGLPPTSDRVVRQGWEQSCGAAALATILTYQFGDQVREDEVIQGLLEYTTIERVTARSGFSLLDLKRYAEARGYTADGYGNVTITELAEFGPSIVRLSETDRNHFVVFRGIRNGLVLLSDPAAGERVMKVDDFEELWSRSVFLVRSPARWNKSVDLLSATPADFEHHIDFPTH